MTTARPSFPMSVLEWLRAGYPEGVPPKDRIPLVALLYRQLTPEQIKDVAVALAESAGRAEDPTITPDAIGELVEEVTHTEPSPEDVARVAAVLAAAGWPLAGLDRDEHGEYNENGAADPDEGEAGTDAPSTEAPSTEAPGTEASGTDASGSPQAATTSDTTEPDAGTASDDET